MALAERTPEHVVSVTTIASVPRFVATQQWPWAMPKADFDAFSAGIKTAPAITLKRFSALQAKGAADEREVVKTLRKLVQSEPQAALEDSLQWLGDTDQCSSWQNFNLPMLHIFGAGDALVPETAAKQFENSVVIAGAGHAPMLSQPEALAQTLNLFWGDV